MTRPAGHRRRQALCALVVVTILGGCSGGDGDRSPAGAATTTTTTTSAPTTTSAGSGTPPGDRGDGAAPPGTLLRATPRTAPDVPAGARAWDVSYRSTAADGELVAVTGVVFAPAADGPADGGGDRPILSWAHGTTGVADLCAPSATRTSVASLEELLAAGYVVAATDYEGLGTPEVHPYLVGGSAGRNVLDAARAARQVEGTGAGAGSPTLVYGHSQGGHAALFAAELAPAYAPELQVAGVVAAAPPIDLEAMLAGATATSFGLGFFVSAAVGFTAAYPELRLEDVLTPAGVAGAAVVEAACIPVVLAAFLSEPVTTFVATRPSDVPAWAARIAENVPGAGLVPVPTLVIQGDRDPLVSAASTQAGVELLCRAGAAVELRRYPQADHGSVLAAAEVEVLDWLAARLTGEPAASTC